MKTNAKIAIAALAAVTALAAGTAVAGGHGPGFRGHRFGGPGPTLLERFDANGDGAVTQAEIDQVRAGRFSTSDTNGDSALTLDEYQALWLDLMRERMVDSFQELDADGDGRITAAEYDRPFASMVNRLDRNGDGRIDAADRPQRGPEGRPAPNRR